MKKIFSLLAAVFTFIYASAQNDEGAVQMADLMRKNGKIYVVVAVIVTILAGLILYLVRLDKRIGKLEKNN